MELARNNYMYETAVPRELRTGTSHTSTGLQRIKSRPCE